MAPHSLIGHVQERLWRLRAKRAWIREEIQALRGFPDEDADYAEPWSDALGGSARGTTHDRSSPCMLAHLNLAGPGLTL